MQAEPPEGAAKTQISNGVSSVVPEAVSWPKSLCFGAANLERIGLAMVSIDATSGSAALCAGIVQRSSTRRDDHVRASKAIPSKPGETPLSHDDEEGEAKQCRRDTARDEKARRCAVHLDWRLGLGAFERDRVGWIVAALDDDDLSKTHRST